MKNKKWLWITLTTLLTIIVLVGVAGAAFRMGAMQSTNLMNGGQFPQFGRMHGFEDDFNNQPGRNPQMMQSQGFSHNQFGRGGFDHGRHGGFFSPIFGLIHLALAGLVLWLGYTLIKKSGWRITRVAQPVVTDSETPSVAANEKKE